MVRSAPSPYFPAYLCSLLAGVAIANSWRRSTNNWVRNTKINPTSWLQRWMPLPTSSKTSKSKVSPRSSLLLRRVFSAEWSNLFSVSIRLFPKDSDEPIDYQGERTLDGLSKFIDSEGKEGAKIKEEVSDESFAWWATFPSAFLSTRRLKKQRKLTKKLNPATKISRLFSSPSILSVSCSVHRTTYCLFAYLFVSKVASNSVSRWWTLHGVADPQMNAR